MVMNMPKSHQMEGDLPFEQFITPVVEAYRCADAPSREAILTKLNSTSLQMMSSYARVMAVQAIRRESQQLVILGLAALAIYGDNGDIRDSIISLALLHNSALKLGMASASTFGQIALLSQGNNLRKEMTRFPSRCDCRLTLEVL